MNGWPGILTEVGHELCENEHRDGKERLAVRHSHDERLQVLGNEDCIRRDEAELR